jgi:hypothetical protein
MAGATLAAEGAAAAFLAAAFPVGAYAFAVCTLTVDVTGRALATELATRPWAAGALTIAAGADACGVVAFASHMARWLFAVEFAAPTDGAGAASAFAEVALATEHEQDRRQ